MYLVFDIGGTNMRMGISSDGKTITQTKITPTTQNFEQGIQILKQTADELSKDQKIEAIGGGIAGVLDKDKTGLIRSPHVPGWAKKPLKETLEKIFGVKVKLENDTAIEGLGEANFGAGRNKEIIAYITIGTGIGGVRIINGQIDKNAWGFEPGHQIIVPGGNPCECGGKGHLETYVAGKYLDRLYHQKGEDITDPNIWDQVAKHLAIGLTNVVVHWSPDIVILGGGVSQSIPMERVKAYLEQFLTIFPQQPPLVSGSLSKEAGLFGALHLMVK